MSKEAKLARLKEELLTQQQVADALDVSDRTVRRWISEGYFPAPIRIGRTPYWTPKTIAGFMAGLINPDHH